VKTEGGGTLRQSKEFLEIFLSRLTVPGQI
jgi:hypothetical protein